MAGTQEVQAWREVTNPVYPVTSSQKYFITPCREFKGSIRCQSVSPCDNRKHSAELSPLQMVPLFHLLDRSRSLSLQMTTLIKALLSQLFLEGVVGLKFKKLIYINKLNSVDEKNMKHHMFVLSVKKLSQ